MAVEWPVLRYPGSKWRIAEWIVSLMPDHALYLEPFFGSGSVLFHKRPARLETVNDRNGQIVNLFRIIREQPEKFASLVEMTPWAREEYDASVIETDDPIERARLFLVRCWQAHAASNDRKTGWSCTRTATNPNMPKRWGRLPEVILAAAGRLRQVQIENMDAIELIERCQAPNVLIYADPPYPMQSRTGTRYENEMTDDDHRRLLEALRRHPGPVLLSGYRCGLYDENLQGWTVLTKDDLAEGGTMRKEALWLNPIAIQKQPGIFRGCEHAE